MMITPPFSTDPTLEALRQKLREIEANQEKRSYLGASGVGHSCERHCWYYYHKPELRKPLDDKAHLAVNDGHRTEDVMANYLRMVDGVELVTHSDDGKQISFIDLGGQFRGHIDGMIRGLHQAPKTVHVWECKATNQKKFEEFRKLKDKHGEKDALRQWNPVYYAQAQIYMHYMECSRHYTTVCLAGLRDFDSCRTEYDKGYAEMLIQKAKRIIEAPEPLSRVSEKADFYLCRWCDFNEVCHAKP